MRTISDVTVDMLILTHTHTHTEGNKRGFKFARNVEIFHAWWICELVMICSSCALTRASCSSVLHFALFQMCNQHLFRSRRDLKYYNSRGFWPLVQSSAVLSRINKCSQTPSRCSNAPTIAPLPTWIRIGGRGSLWTFPSLNREGAIHPATTRWELLNSCRKEHNCRRTCHKFDKIALSPTVIASNTLSAITINIRHRLTIFLSPW